MNSKLKILIVEDDALIGADLSKTLTVFGYEVIGPIITGEEALERVVSLKPDCILMDIKLQGKIDGIQTAEEIQHKIALPIVFLTGLTDDASFQRAKLLNPYGYLIKPFDPQELRTTIELTLHRFNSRSEGIGSDPTLESDWVEFNPAALPVDSETATEKSTIVSSLSQLPLFRGLPSAAVDQLAQYCSLRRFEAGEFISFEGDDAQGGFIPINGRISITKTASSGKELIVALLAPGHAFGVQFALKSFSAALSARTQIASRIIWIPTSHWNALRESYPVIDKNLCTLLAQRLISAYELASSLAHASVEGRIVQTLLALLPQFGKPTAQLPNSGRIYITRKELAELTGTTPETAYRVTKHLERENLLDLTRPGILKINDINLLRSTAT